MLRPRMERFGVDALTGRMAYVVDEVTDRTGTVRIGGEDWTARALDQGVVIPVGAAETALLSPAVSASVVSTASAGPAPPPGGAYSLTSP